MIVLLVLGAQVPPNDLCQNAIELNYIEGQCIEANFSVKEATNEPVNGCFSEEADVWFKLTVPNDLGLIIKVFDLNFDQAPKCAVFTGDCSNLEVYDCLQNQSYYNDTTLFILLDSALVGDEIYLRIFDEAFNSDSNKLCVQAIDFSDFNGICQNATELLYSSEVCDPDLLIIDTMNAERSFDLYHEIYCDMSMASLWYHINLPAQTRIIVEVEMVDAFYDFLFYETYEGSCNQLNFLECGYIQNFYSIGKIVLENFTDESLSRTIKIASEFEDKDEIIIVCVKELTPVDNEICDAAIHIDLSPYAECTEVPSIEFAAVINEATFDNDNCFFEMADVWYSFDSGDSIKEVVLNMIPDNYIYESLGIEFYNGPDCQNLSFAFCEQFFLETYQTEYLLTLPDFPDSRWFIRMGMQTENVQTLLNLCFSSITEIENDDCLDAVLIDLEGDCHPFVNLGSTNSTENFCTDNNDVWFKFIYNVESLLSIKTKVLSASGPFNIEVSFFRGDCENLELIECSGNSNASLEQLLALHNPDLDGQMIYIAVANIPVNGQIIPATYGICPFLNQINTNEFDYCSVAKSLYVNNEAECDSSYNLDFDLNRYSGIGNACHASEHRKDAWFIFTVPDDGKFTLDVDHFEIDPFSNFKSLSFYTGACAYPELISCIELNKSDFSERFYFESLANKDIYMQLIVESFGAVDYNICIRKSGSFAAPNDHCQSAKILETSQGQCTNPNIVNNVNAHRTEQEAACPGFSNDVWFSFVVPASGNLIIETSIVSGSELTDGVFALYAGDCNNLNLIICDDDSGQANMPAYKISDGALANQELFLQFWSFNGAQEGSFEICLIEPEDLIGDDCEQAIELLVGSKDDCYESSESTLPFLANTYSGIIPNCSASISSDIWFTFSYKESERLVFEFKQSTGSSLFDGQAAIYRAVCDDLIFVACDDDSGPANMPAFDMEDLIDPLWDGDQDFYVQFWDFNQGIGDDISFCLYDKALDYVINPFEETFRLSPNPTTDIVDIEIVDQNELNYSYAIADIHGKQLVPDTKISCLANKKCSIDLSQFAPSTYIIIVSSESQRWIKKIVKF